MFTSRVEAILKSVSLDSDGPEQRIAHCLFHIPLTFELARQLSPKVAEDLYRLNGKNEWAPRIEMNQVKFDDLHIPDQRMEFRALPEVSTPNAILPGVEMRYFQAIKQKKHDDLTLVMGVRFFFHVAERAAVSVLVIDHLKQSVWLTFSDQQRKLISDRQEEGEFVNTRAARSRAR